MTDERLLADFLSHRDDSAFEALVRRYGPMVIRVCRDVLGDREYAEDAFQATFLVLSRQAGTIRERGALGRWLYEVACRISRRERRRWVRVRSQERQAPEMEAVAPPDFDPADHELKPILHEEIGRLPSRLREAIVLCYFEGLTVEDAARQLDCPVGTLKSRLAKGRETLRTRLTRRGLAASALLFLLFSMTEETRAALTDSLVEAAVTSRGIAGSRVAAIVRREEARTWLVRMAGSLAVLVVMLLVFGASRAALGRKAQAEPLIRLVATGPTIPSSSRENRAWSLFQGFSPKPSCPVH